VQTPQLLQVSGIGPKDVLKAAGIKVKKDMPSVGANFQDHPTTFMTFNLSHQSFPNPDSLTNNATYNATAWEQYFFNRTGPIASGRSSIGAFLSLPQITSQATSTSITTQFLSQNASQYLPSIYSYAPLLQGFKAQRSILAKRFTTNTMGVGGFPLVANGLAPVSFHKTTSRGTITLNLTHPHALPIVQYNTLMNPIDTSIILAMIRRNRAFWQKPELAFFGAVESTPGAQYQTDEELLFALTQKGGLLPALAHPSGTCALMPEDLGGCVAPDLKVYGTKGLSVVDASIMPLIPASTLQATMYAIGEKAADLIKARA
jgi:choline dehydrogenase-like flavoprotein